MLGAREAFTERAFNGLCASQKASQAKRQILEWIGEAQTQEQTWSKLNKRLQLSYSSRMMQDAYEEYCNNISSLSFCKA